MKVKDFLSKAIAPNYGEHYVKIEASSWSLIFLVASANTVEKKFQDIFDKEVLEWTFQDDFSPYEGDMSGSEKVFSTIFITVAE